MVFYRIRHLSSVGHLDSRITLGEHKITVAVKYTPEHIEHTLTARVEHMTAASVEEISVHTLTFYQSAGA